MQQTGPFTWDSGDLGAKRPHHILAKVTRGIALPSQWWALSERHIQKTHACGVLAGELRGQLRKNWDLCVVILTLTVINPQSGYLMTLHVPSGGHRGPMHISVASYHIMKNTDSLCVCQMLGHLLSGFIWRGGALQPINFNCLVCITCSR